MKFNKKEILKNSYSFGLQLIKTCFDLLKVIIFSSFKSHKHLEKIRNKFQGEECYVLGNGPSLKNLLEKDNYLITGKNVLAVNFFCSTKYFQEVRPRFYMIIDSLLFNEDSEDHHLGNYKRFREALKSVYWDMYIFAPKHFKNSQLVKLLSNSHIRWIWINTTPLNGLKSIRYFLYNRSLGMPFPQTVINAAIFIAIRVKFKNINLFGVEQSWLKGMYVDENNVVRTELDHFYQSKIDVKAPSLSNLLLTQHYVFKGHEELQEYAASLNINILNHVKESYIDSYNKVIS